MWLAGISLNYFFNMHDKKYDDAYCLLVMFELWSRIIMYVVTQQEQLLLSLLLLFVGCH